ncbi:unnamed protein product, partial [marine sediment metagenome]
MSQYVIGKEYNTNGSENGNLMVVKIPVRYVVLKL